MFTHPPLDFCSILLEPIGQTRLEVRIRAKPKFHEPTDFLLANLPTKRADIVAKTLMALVKFVSLHFGYRLRIKA